MKIKLLRKLRRKSLRHAYVTKNNYGKHMRLSLFERNGFVKTERKFYLLDKKNNPVTRALLLQHIQTTCDEVRREYILASLNRMRKKHAKHKRIY